ncbi:MAG: translation initiation factor IF-2 [Anaerovoracaceae bacterium]|jgi:translation initiation factor IF-2
MTVKIKDLAEELNVEAKVLVEKAKAVGIEVKTVNSSMSDEDSRTLKNNILAGRAKDAESKIVKKDDGSKKVTVKAARVAERKPKKAPAAAAVKKDESAKPQQRKAPIGRPMGKSESAAHRPPIGKAVPKRVTKAEKEKEELEAAKAAQAEEAAKMAEEAAKKAGEAAKAEKTEEKPEPEQVKKEETAPKAEEPAAAKEAEKKTAGKKEEKAAPEKKAAEKKEEKPAKAEKKSAAGGNARRNGIAPQKIKIIKTAEQVKAEEKAAKEKRAAAKKKREEEEKAKAEERRSKRRAQAPAESEAPAHGGGRKKKKKKEREFDKFSKIEEKREKNLKGRSLEKKTRGKHVKKTHEEDIPQPEEEALPVGTKVIDVPITIAGFCEQTGVSISKVIMTLLSMGVVANQNQNIDDVTVATLADELGINVVIGRVEDEEEDEGLETFEDREKDLKPRPPVITVMGHVDHGKTSLLDAIRNTNVTDKESGGITQHIGASEVEVDGKKIVFLDTPGHEAFTAMRARGADITDIAVLVVAADDSVMPQTVESISHAKAAGVPIIVAMNKMDKPGANPDKVKQDLAEHGVLVEDWGGDTICVPVSAKTGEGIKNLLEMILLQAEVLELKANPDRLAMGNVIEARLDKAKGTVATLLVMNGTLKAGQSIVAGTCSGRIRRMTDYKGKTIRKAGPATPVEVLGLNDVPMAGDTFNAVSNDKKAKEIAERRAEKQREEVMARTSSSTLEELFQKIQEGETKELDLVIKADVMGSVGAVQTSLEKLSNDEVKVKIIHAGVGAITESDVILAGTSNAIIIGFNVRPSAAVKAAADREHVQIKTYTVIYNIIDDVENAIKGMLDPEFEEVVLGECEIRDTFKVPDVGVVGGAYVTNGKIVRNASVRLVRDGIVIHEGKISSLKRYKDDAKEVVQGYECGIGIENYNDIKEGDIIECYEMQEVERK